MFNLTAYSFYETDLILSPLYKKYFHKFGRYKVLSTLFFFPIILCFIAGYIEGTLYNKPNFVGVIRDYSLYSQWLVVLLSLLLFSNFSRFAKEFFRIGILQTIDVLKLKEDEKNQINKLDEQLSSLIGAKGIFRYIEFLFVLIFFGVNIIVITYAFNPQSQYKSDIWHSANYPIGFFILKLFNLIYTGILLPIFFYKFLFSLLGISWLFKRISDMNAFIVRPLSPDKSAGLKILSNLSIYFMYMVLPFFLIFITNILRGTSLTANQQLELTALIGLLFLTFFLPLGFVHSAMKRAKEKELENISVNFSELNEDVKKIMKRKNYDEDFNTKISALEKMDFLYNKTEKMPIWPFNLTNLVKVLIASLIPIFVFILELVVNPESILYDFDKLLNLVHKFFS